MPHDQHPTPYAGVPYGDAPSHGQVVEAVQATSRTQMVSRPVFYRGTGVCMWDVPTGFRVLAVFEDGSSQDLTKELGEMIALGLPLVGEETGVVDDDSVKVADVVVEGGDGSERFYVINVAERNVAVVELEMVMRAVAAAVKHLIETGITEEPTPRIDPEEIQLH